MNPLSQMALCRMDSQGFAASLQSLIRLLVGVIVKPATNYISGGVIVKEYNPHLKEFLSLW